MLSRGAHAAVLVFFVVSAMLVTMPANAAEPIRIGLSVALSGGSAALGRQVLAGLELWRDDVNAKGGLLGRPVQLIAYDDQTQPATVPAIYTKLITVDKVDLLLGPYATNLIAAAMPVLIQNRRLTIGIFGLGVNSQFNYPLYFSMNAQGPQPKVDYSKGFFELAASQKPKPVRVALVGADAEFAKNALDGARENAKGMGFTIVYDRAYPPATTDFAPIIRAIRATNPDVVYAATYPVDTVGLVRAARELNLAPKLFGGGMVGLLATPIKVQLGELLNGIVNYEFYLPAPTLSFPGTDDFLKKYQAVVPGLGIDPLGYTFPPYAYAAGQVLAQAVEATKTLDNEKLAAHMREHTFPTLVGDIAFGRDGEWRKARSIFAQFRGITGSDIGQLRDVSRQPIVWPPELKTGELAYPFSDIKP